LFTSTSTGPNSARVVSSKLASESSSVRSVTTGDNVKLGPEILVRTTRNPMEP
jgi:hypothetical protein